MKLRDRFEKHLIDNGMFDAQAKVVMDAVVADPANEAMAGRWNDDDSGYTEPLLNLTTYIVNQAAVEWIDANLPRAWFRPMFAPKSEAVAATGHS